MFFMIALTVIILYPLIFIVSSSFSSGAAVSTGKVVFLPVDFSVEGYVHVFNYPRVWTCYGNTIFYTVVGTCLNLFLTVLVAYPLSRKNFQGRGFYLTIFLFTMWFSGGMIPTYILMSRIGLVNSRWTLIFMGAISTYNMIVMRSFFSSSIPADLFDAARIDGASDIGYLLKIVIPLSGTIVAVLTVYYAVGKWNDYFTALVYLRDTDYWPLQTVLRQILATLTVSSGDLAEMFQDNFADAAETLRVANVVKYCSIIVSTVPVVILYLFMQDFFVKGVMIGSVKG